MGRKRDSENQGVKRKSGSRVNKRQADPSKFKDFKVNKVNKRFNKQSKISLFRIFKNYKNKFLKKNFSQDKIDENKKREIKVKFDLDKNQSTDGSHMKNLEIKPILEKQPTKSLLKKRTVDKPVVVEVKQNGKNKKAPLADLALKNANKKAKLQLDLNTSDGENSEDDIAKHIFSDSDDEIVDDYGNVGSEEDEEEEEEDGEEEDGEEEEEDEDLAESDDDENGIEQENDDDDDDNEVVGSDVDSSDEKGDNHEAEDDVNILI